MVLSSCSRCMILTMVRNFDHLLPILRLICGVLGRKIIPWLPVLPSQRVVRQRLVLDQIPILWKVKYSGEREEMDSHLENIWSFFIWAPYLNSLEWRYGSCLSFFLISSAPFFLKEDDPYSIMIEFLEGSTAWIDHSIWICSLWIYWILLWGNCLAKVDINTRSR